MSYAFQLHPQTQEDYKVNKKKKEIYISSIHHPKTSKQKISQTIGAWRCDY